MAPQRQSGKSEDEEDLLPDSTKDNSCCTLRKKPCCRFVVEPLMLLYIIAGMPMTPLYEQYIYIKVGMSMGIDVNNLTESTGNGTTDSCTDGGQNDTAYQQREMVQAEAAKWQMYISLSGFFPSLVAMTVYGTAMDKVGRRIGLCLPSIGIALQAVVFMSIVYFDLPLPWYFLTNITYLFGNMETLFIACFSYLADTTTPKERAMRMTFLDVMVMLGGAVTQLGIGYWIRSAGYFWPYLWVIGGKLLAFVYAFFVIPETIKNPSRRNMSPKVVANAFKLYIYDDSSRRRWKIWMVMLPYLVHEMFSSYGLTTLFTMNSPLCWDSVLLGWYHALWMGVACIGGTIGAFLTKCLAEDWLLLLGRLSYTIYDFYKSMVTTTLMMFMAPLISMFGFIATPMSRAIISKLVAQEEQGALFASMFVVSTTCRMCGKLIMNNIYASTVVFWHGFVFLVAGVAGCLASLLVLLYIYLVRRERRQNVVLETEVTADDNHTEEHPPVDGTAPLHTHSQTTNANGNIQNNSI